VKTIRLSRGATTITFEPVPEIRRDLEKELHIFKFQQGRTEIIDDGRGVQTIMLIWHPQTDASKTKEQKIEEVIDAVRSGGDPWTFEWGVSGETGARSFTVQISKVREIETGGSVRDSTVIIEMKVVET